MARRVVVDANLAILLIAGMTDRRIIGLHKRLQTFRTVGYDLVCDFLGRHGTLVLLPHIATETSNLLGQVRDPYKTALLQTMKTIVETHTELAISSQAAVSQPEFLRLGVTDAAILSAINETTILLTTDLGLFLAALAKGLEAWNFEQLRDQTL